MPESLTAAALIHQVIENFLKKLTEAQRLLLAECDRPPYYSEAEKAIVLECSKPWLPLAIEQQDGILNAAQEMGIEVKIKFLGSKRFDPKS